MTFQMLLILLSIIAIIIVVIGVVAPKRWIAVPDDFSVKLETGGGVAATLIRKGWGFSSYKNVGGTITIRNPNTSHYSITPSQKTTTAAAPAAIFTISPSSVGTSSIQFQGRSSHGAHTSLLSSGPWVAITVTA